MEPRFVSSMFVAPKKGGGQRPVINLKGLNNYLEYSTFKMEGIHMLRDLLRKRRLYVGIGPQGCLFHGFSLVTLPKIIKISVEENNVGICVPLRCLCQCSKSLYQNNETSGGLVAQNGGKANSPSGRHLNHGRDQTSCSSTYPISFQHSGKSRLCGELREVSHDSIPFDGIPGFPIGFHNYVSSFTRRKSSQDTTRVPEVLNSILPGIAQAYKVDRVAQQLHSRFLSSPPPSPPLTKRKESTFLLSNKLRKWNAPISSSTRRPNMVERQFAGLERQGLGKWGPRDGRRPTGMGSCLQWSTNGMSLDSFRKTTPHQLLRVDGGSLNSQSLHSTQNSSEGSFAYVQYDSSNIYQQNGGTRSPILWSLAFELWTWYIHIKTYFRHIPGSQNLLVDWEPRSVVDHSDWKLTIFQHIQRLWDPLETDLVASRLSYQIPRYASWRPDPGAEAVDAFTLVSTDGYAFSPFALVGRCLK